MWTSIAIRLCSLQRIEMMNNGTLDDDSGQAT